MWTRSISSAWMRVVLQDDGGEKVEVVVATHYCLFDCLYSRIQVEKES